MDYKLIEQIRNKREQRLDVLEELVNNLHNNTGEMLGIIEEIKYLEFLQNNLTSKQF
ncbi:hypothetical protein J6P92_07050 [bacterium]|nr:hypothetical protein [bacterium]